MSVLVGTGNIIWSGIYVIVSTIGLVISVALLDVFYINPFQVKSWWYKGLLFIACMSASVLIFGGFVIGIWHFWERKTSAGNESEENAKIGFVQQNKIGTNKSFGLEKYANCICYGQRPKFGGTSFLSFLTIICWLVEFTVTTKLRDLQRNELFFISIVTAEIFGSISDRWGNVDIGVIVCGPSTLTTSVAKECRTNNLNRKNNQPIFHFHSHSFDL